MMLSNHPILCDPLLLLHSIFPSIIVFSIESALHIRWPKYWSFSISSVNEYSGLISFRINWFDLLSVQGTLKSLLQHQNLKALVLQCSALFMVQLSHLYVTTGKIVALTIQTFVNKVMSLFFNTLSRFVIAFPPRSKHLLISWMQSGKWPISTFSGAFASFLFWLKEDLFGSKAWGTAKYHLIGEFDSMGYHGCLNSLGVSSLIRPGWFYSKWEFMKSMLLHQYN